MLNFMAFLLYSIFTKSLKDVPNKRWFSLMDGLGMLRNPGVGGSLSAQYPYHHGR